MIKILLFEDEPHWQKIICAAISDEGHEVSDMSENKEGGLALAKKHLPDLILIDIALADGDTAGLDLAKELHTAGFPFVYMTQHDDTRMYRAVHDPHAPQPLDYVPKTAFSTYKAPEVIQRLILKYEQAYPSITFDGKSFIPGDILFARYENPCINVYIKGQCQAVALYGKTLAEFYKRFENYLDYANRQVLINLKAVVKVDTQYSEAKKRFRHSFWFPGHSDPIPASFEESSVLFEKLKRVNPEAAMPRA